MQLTATGNSNPVVLNNIPEIRALKNELGISTVVCRQESVRFVCTGFKQLLEDEKGYVYFHSKEAPAWVAGKVAAKLDGVVLTRGEILYKDLGGGWFLYLQATD